MQLDIKGSGGFTAAQLTTINTEYRQAINSLSKFYTSGSIANLENRLKRVEVIANGRMKTTAGRATTNRNIDLGTINMNKRLFSTTGTLEDFKNTFLHELAHIFANFMHGANCGHSPKWKDLFLSIGGNGERCHRIEVNHLRAKKKVFVYSCSCDTHHVGIRMHNRILKNQSRFKCKSCKEVISYENKYKATNAI